MRIFARSIFGLTALVSIVGITMASTLAWLSSPEAEAKLGGPTAVVDYFDSAFARVANVYSAFTIQSNLLVCVVSIILFVNPDRSSEVFRVFRLMGLGAITVTGIVYNLILLPQDHPEGIALFMNMLLHAAVPLLALLGWLVWGPRLPFRIKYLAWSLLYGVAWATFTLVRGALTGWYTYPFVNAAEIGYGRVAINLLAITVFFLVVASAILGLDKVLPNRAEQATAESDSENAPQPTA